MLENTDKTKNPFKIPENYFENFNAEIMNKLPEKNIQKAKIIPLWKKIVPWTAVAAIFSGILFMTGILDKGTMTDPTMVAGQPDLVISSGIASNTVEDDYYLFLEDEVADAKFKEIMFSN